MTRTFSSDQTSNINGIVTALDLHNNLLEQGKDVLDDGLTEIENEFDELQTEISNAQGRKAQLDAVRRLANKIECTEDCFVSDDQADAIIDGLNENDANVEKIINGVRNASKNQRTTVKKKRSDGKLKKDEDKLYADIIDAAIALQNPEFEFTKTMASKGKSNETLQTLLKFPNASNFSLVLDEFLSDAEIQVPTEIDAADFVRRNRRQIKDASDSTIVIIEAINDVTQALEKHSLYLENLEELKKPSEVKIQTKDATRNVDQRIFSFASSILGIDDLLEEGINAVLNPIFSNIFDKIGKPIAQSGIKFLEILLQKFVAEQGAIGGLLDKILVPLNTLINNRFDSAATLLSPDGYLKPNNPAWLHNL